MKTTSHNLALPRDIPKWSQFRFRNLGRIKSGVKLEATVFVEIQGNERPSGAEISKKDCKEGREASDGSMKVLRMPREERTKPRVCACRRGWGALDDSQQHRKYVLRMHWPISSSHQPWETRTIISFRVWLILCPRPHWEWLGQTLHP